MNQTSEVGPRLRLTIEREKRGWTKRKLAQQADMDAGLISKFELRRQVPYPPQLARIAKALNVPAKNAATLMEPMSE